MVLQQQVDNQRYQPSIKGSVSPSEDNRGGTKVFEKMVSDNGKRCRIIFCLSVRHSMELLANSVEILKRPGEAFIQTVKEILEILIQTRFLDS